MARERSMINTALWNDADFRAVPWPAQHLYFVLWTHPGLSYAGVVDWRPSRIAPMAGGGWTAPMVEEAADCLAARMFLVLDRGTEEALLRSFVRWDGLMRQGNLGVSFALAYGQVASNAIRSVIVHEAVKLRKIEPELNSWSRPQVKELLAQPATDPRSLTIPEDPWPDGVTLQLTPRLTPPLTPGLGVNLGAAVDPPVDPPPTSSTATTTSLQLQLRGAADADAPATPRKREHPLPTTWEPNAKHLEYATKHALNIAFEVENFRNNAEQNDRRARSWDGAFRNWMAKSVQMRDERGTSRRPARDDGPVDRSPNITELRLAGLLDEPAPAVRGYYAAIATDRSRPTSPTSLPAEPEAGSR